MYFEFIQGTGVYKSTQNLYILTLIFQMCEEDWIKDTHVTNTCATEVFELIFISQQKILFYILRTKRLCVIYFKIPQINTNFNIFWHPECYGSLLDGEIFLLGMEISFFVTWQEFTNFTDFMQYILKFLHLN